MRREPSALRPIAEVVEEFRAGRIVILVDDEDRENEGDLVFAAEFATAEKVNFLATHGRGLICMPMSAAHAAQLGLRPMVGENRSRHGTNFMVSIEAAEGVTTGISAHDRALTIRTAAARDAKPSDIVQPGHVFPLVAAEGGVLVRAGHTEACVDLARLAGLAPAAVLCEIMNEDGTMARLPDLVEFAARHGLKMGSIADLIEYRSATESLIERIAERFIETAGAGGFRLVAYRDAPSGGTHLALVRGEPRRERETLVRVHEPLSVLDLLEVGPGTHSWGVHETLQAIARAGTGVLLFLNCAQQDRALQEQLRDPQRAGGRPAARSATLRNYGIGAQILRELGVGRMRLMATPRRMPSMAGFGLEVVGYLERSAP